MVTLTMNELLPCAPPIWSHNVEKSPKEIQLLSEEELAEIFGCNPVTLMKWRKAGIGPKYLRLGKMIRYDWEDVRAFLDSSRVDPATGTEGAIQGEE